jgi:hypothetical protein
VSVKTLTAGAILFFLAWAGVTAGDEAPVAGTVQAVDLTAKTLTVEARARGGPRLVVIEVRAESKIIRSRRSSDPARPGFVEEPVLLEQIKPGWSVSVTTKHDADREIAVVIKILAERPSR